MYIIFWTFFQGLHSLLERLMHFFPKFQLENSKTQITTASVVRGCNAELLFESYVERQNFSLEHVRRKVNGLDFTIV